MSFRIPVSFGNASHGDGTVSLACATERTDHMTLDRADEYLGGKQVELRIIRGGGEAANGQKTIPGGDHPYEELQAIAKIKSFRTGPKRFSFGLSFDLGQGEEISGVWDFAWHKGAIEFESAIFIPDDKPKKPGKTKPIPFGKDLPRGKVPVPGQPDAGGQAKLLSAFKKHGITPAKCEAIAVSIGGDTVAELEAVIRRDRDWYKKIDGFGQKWVDKLSDAIVAHRLEFPEPPEGTAEEKAEGRAAVQMDAFAEGLGAAQAGKGEEDNPYPVGQPGQLEWNMGWHSDEKQAVAAE